MARLSPKLRSTTYGVAHWCPACKEPHVYNVRSNPHAPNGPMWSYDDNVDAPTFAPSMLLRTGNKIPGYESRFKEGSICHYFLRAGRIEYLGDSTHAMAGQTIDLPDWPTEGDWSSFEDGNASD